MQQADYAKLLEDLEHQLTTGARSVGILGLTSVTLRLLGALAPSGLLEVVRGVFVGSSEPDAPPLSVPIKPLHVLEAEELDVLVVASDAEKEDMLRAAEPFIQGAPKVLVAGYGHHAFRDPVFHEELARLLVPSLANGYPNSLPHLYQCLENAARLKLRGVVAEFGTYKGGTTMFLSRVAERLGVDWRIITFDTFEGFPPRRSPFDMYDHPDCEFDDLASVKGYLGGRNIEIVPGDIVDTCRRLQGEDVVLTFVDTDNFSPATAVVDVVRERTVVGGAIVFDHYTGVDRFRYTLGERLAARALVDDPRFFHLHGTGVFYRQLTQ